MVKHQAFPLQQQPPCQHLQHHLLLVQNHLVLHPQVLQLANRAAGDPSNQMLILGN